MFVLVYAGIFGGMEVSNHTAETLTEYAKDMGVCRKGILDFISTSKQGEYTTLPQQHGGQVYIVIIRTR